MYTIFNSHFNLVEKLISLGFKELKECENETIFRIANNSARHGQYIIILISATLLSSHDTTVFLRFS